MNDSKTIKIALSIIALTIVVYLLRELKSIFIPLTFAVFLSFLFQPLNRFLHERKVPVGINLFIIVIIILFTFTLMGAIVYTSISSFVTDFPKYENSITHMIQTTITHLGIPMEDVTIYVTNKVNWLAMADKLSLSKIVSATMGNFIDFFVKLLLTVAFMIFIILERSALVSRVAKVITEDNAIHSGLIVGNIEKQIKTYILSKTFISLATGLIGMFFVAIYGIDFVVISGLLLFVLNYIPNFGSIVASLFPIIICFIQYGISWQLIAISASLAATQMTIGNFIEPKIMGVELKLSPLFILISLIFWFWIWGPVGMILAVPVTSAINLIIKEIPSLKIISALISSE